MKKIFNLTSISIIASTAIFIVGIHFVWNISNIPTASAQQGGSNYITKMNISTGVSVATSSVNLLPASSGRVYAVIVNDGTEPVYLSMNGSSAIPNQGVRINPNGGSYEINFLNQYVGAINAITETGTSNVTVEASQ